MSAEKRQRLSSEETRERLIRAGYAALADVGISVGLDAVSLEQAIRDSGVSRSSAYAVWSDDDELAPQESFQREVLGRAMGHRVEATREFRERLEQTYAEHGQTMTPLELRREIVRVVGNSHVQAIEQIVEWRIVIALRAILLSAPPGGRDERLLTWLRASERAGRLETITSIYRPATKMLQMVPRPEYGDAAFHYAEAAAASLTEGLAVRSALKVDYLPADLHHPDDDPTKTWSIYSLVFERILDLFFMPVDEDE